MTRPEGGVPGPESYRDAGPRIYAASLSDYNAGVLHGVWLEAAEPVEQLHEAIGEMLAESPTTHRYGDVAEEWAIHDYEGFGSHLRIEEFDSLDRVHLLAARIAEHGEAFGAWQANQGDDDEAEQFEDHFAGEFSSAEDYGEHLLDEMGFDPADLPEVPESLRLYISVDVAGWVRDMQLGGEIFMVESPRGVYVFWQ